MQNAASSHDLFPSPPVRQPADDADLADSPVPDSRDGEYLDDSLDLDPGETPN